MQTYGMFMFIGFLLVLLRKCKRIKQYGLFIEMLKFVASSLSSLGGTSFIEIFLAGCGRNFFSYTHRWKLS